MNPPLVRWIASLPVLATGIKTDWNEWRSDAPYSRPEFDVGRSLVLTNGEEAFWQFSLARWACLPLCLVGAWTVFRWARELYGDFAGITALWLYCFCPNLIAWGASITPDAVGAALGILAAYTFWRWLMLPGWSRAIQAGIALGLAELTKGTWIILFVVFPVIWLACRISMRRIPKVTRQSTPGFCAPATGAGPFRQLTAILAIALYLLNLGYGFEGSFKLLKEYQFVSKTLSGESNPPRGANQFAASWIGQLPIPLPESYVSGLDLQKLDFERGGWSYLCGEQHHGGWWYYYLAAFCFKSPLGSLTIFGIATGLVLFRRDFRADWRSELTLMLPAIAVMALVSSQTGFNRYLRYALPFVPFACVHCGRVARLLDRRHTTGSSLLATCEPLPAHDQQRQTSAAERALPTLRPRGATVLVMLCLLGTAIESASVSPHCMSFFNICVGGPLNGDAYLLDSNIDWAQDMLYLKRWYAANPQARPFHLERFGSLVASPEAAGIESQPVPGFLPADALHDQQYQPSGPQPGWFALSINHIKGYHHYGSDRPEFTYFQRLKPIARAGYSIQIYHLTPDQADALRIELGLQPLKRHESP